MCYLISKWSLLTAILMRLETREIHACTCASLVGLRANQYAGTFAKNKYLLRKDAKP